MTRLLVAADAPQEEWLTARQAGIGASEIAAVLGISPWESPFSLYWRKRNDWRNDDAEHLEAGRRAEGMIADWFADRADPNEGLAVRPAGLYAHRDRPWQLATPDRLVHLVCPCCCGDGYGCGCTGVPGLGCGDCRATGIGSPPVAVLECKHPYSWDGFGDDGSDDIPVYCRCQLLQQMDVMGVDDGYLAAYTQHQLRIYHLRRDEADLAVMRTAGAAFMRRLADDDPPPIDGHAATGAALRRLHPSVEDIDVQVPLELAEGYRRARALRSRVDDVVERYENRIRHAIGGGRRAMYGKQLVASRSVYDQSGDQAELTALEGDWPVVDRLNPGRSKSYA